MIPVPPLLKCLLAPDASPRPIADGIWSTVVGAGSNQVYDRHAALYDLLIGSRIYNRIAWGSSPTSYAGFARRAVSSGTGVILDAGCGSLVSTAEIHLASGRPTILCDLSAGMLEAARDRIVRMAGSVPVHLIFVQADILNLPFRDGCFGTVLLPGMLHIFDDVAAATAELARVAAPEAGLFMSSLVAESWIGSRYLALLHRAGEVASPRTCTQLLEHLKSPRSGLRGPFHSELEGSVLFVTARSGAGEGGSGAMPDRAAP